MQKKKPFQPTELPKTAAKNTSAITVPDKIQCPAAAQCGACRLLHSGTPADYALQLREKEAYVRGLFEKNHLSVKEFMPIDGMENPLFYRHKVHHVFEKKAKGQVVSGFYQEGSHKVVAVKDCLIENKNAAAIIQTIEKLAMAFHIPVFNEDTGYGLLRHVLIRVGYHSKEIMVVLVCADSRFPSRNNFVKALRAAHPEITTVIQNINGKKTSAVLGNQNITLFGPGFILDTLCGVSFRLSPNSFYQVNPCQTERLYKYAISFADLKEGDVVLDAYCGIGSIGLCALKNSAMPLRLIGVELNADAVRDARENAKHNQIRSAEFFACDSGDFIAHWSEKTSSTVPSVVFTDPPRSGSDAVFLQTLLSFHPKKIVYISCNPDTLVRDLALLTKEYEILKVQPVDMFPLTDHVETVVLMSNVKE